MYEYKTDKEKAQEYAQAVAEQHNLSDEMRDLIAEAFIEGCDSVDDYEDDEEEGWIDGDEEEGWIDGDKKPIEIKLYKDEFGNIHGVKADDFPPDAVEIKPARTI